MANDLVAVARQHQSDCQYRVFAGNVQHVGGVTLGDRAVLVLGGLGWGVASSARVYAEGLPEVRVVKSGKKG